MVSLSVKNVPEDVLEKLRARAQRNRRSLQAELLAILEDSANPRHFSIDEAYQRIQAIGLKTADDSAQIIREMRDSR